MNIYLISSPNGQENDVMLIGPYLPEGEFQGLCDSVLEEAGKNCLAAQHLADEQTIITNEDVLEEVINLLCETRGFKRLVVDQEASYENSHDWHSEGLDSFGTKLDPIRERLLEHNKRVRAEFEREFEKFKSGVETK